ncbi:hypothetical protein IP68_02285 [Blastomonas sp. AAP25]|uniref:HNH endonuclease n=1 Tax=Blastomonas sp. AAP25 TaxID=1523416 RepID=UPI0006BA0946|nr:HNH endonuclease signature motif containing protein [Blastomonas sp. AAP25]KPF76743.1 hypothetical protein IP68_02285 [Blastomonas sp. AAP25]
MNESFDGERRPPIPAEIRRRVLVEAGHRCAIPTCRYIEVEIHHIIPWANCRSHDYDNLIALCANCHRRADRGEIDRKSLRLYKINLRFAHDKFSQLEMDILFDAARLPPGQGILWTPVMMVLIRRVIEAGYLVVVAPQTIVSIGGLDQSPRQLMISAKGREFLADFGDHEL